MLERMFSTVGETISTVGEIQFCVKANSTVEISSVHWWVFSTVVEVILTVVVFLHCTLCSPHSTEYPPHNTDGFPPQY